MGPSRRSRGAATGAALFAISWMVNGCRSIDCSEIATCTGIGDNLVTANDGAGQANDDAVEPSVGPSDPNDAGGYLNDGDLEACTVAADANGAADDGGLSADVGTAVGDGGDAPSTATTDGAPRCASNVLTPITAVASSMTTHLATQAIDSNFSTRWESVWGVDPQWIYVDFGTKVFVNRVQILWLHACAANYDLQVSNDGATWMTMRSIVGNTTGRSTPPADWTTAVVDHQGLVGFGRYMRINATARCTNLYGYSMWEMRVFGDSNASCSP